MSEETVEETQVIENKFNKEDFIKSQEFVDIINATKGMAVKSFKEEKLQSIIDEEYAKRKDAESKKTPEQLKFEDYENKLAAVQNKLAEKEIAEIKSSNKLTAVNLLSKSKLSPKLADFLTGDSEENTIKNTETMISIFEEFKSSFNADSLSKNNTFVPNDDTSPRGKIPEPGENATKQEWKEYFNKTKK